MIIKGCGMLTIIDFFNPYCLDHIKAYVHLQTHGSWPEGFIPEDMKFPSFWHAAIASKMADAWIEQVKAGHIFGVPGWDQ